ncbi:hypothetical protein F5Y04DRAFT_263402 [Hypomontagnella monticulosa]|nr:hypothetical protein F5Y04DRAFT_263402 [Hypomontagnella monticulosa]
MEGLVSVSEMGAGPRPRSPEARSTKFNFFKEINAEQYQQYTPDQVYTILEQREEVLKAANQGKTTVSPPPGFQHMKSTPPWVPSESNECQFRCCQRCRPSAALRSYLSLDGIVNGDIPPSAAVGFGFHEVGARPVFHPDRFKNLGLRPVPWPKATATPTQSSLSSLNSSDMEYLNRLAAAADSESATLVSDYSGETLPPWLPTPTLTADVIESKLLAAHLTPLPPPTSEEQTSLRTRTSQMMREELEEGRFHKEPLEVDDGVAVSEENVELGLPNVVTQV